MTPGHDDWYEIKKRYLVKETIGSGGFGKVKRAVHIATTETVAIKVKNKFMKIFALKNPLRGWSRQSGPFKTAPQE